MTKDDLKIFTKIPTIKTDRLILRRMCPSDIDDVYEYASDPKVPEFLLWSPHQDKAYTKLYLAYIDRRYKKCDYYDWCIEYNGKVIGTVGFTSFDIPNNSAEIGYVLNSKFWGRGIAREATNAVIEFGFRVLNLNRIEAKCLVENNSSVKVMTGCGMTLEGIRRDAVFCKGTYRDINVGVILKKDYERR